MAYFEDGTRYQYTEYFDTPNTLNVGWLERGMDFPRQPASEDLLAAIWRYTLISVAKARGIQHCNLCDPAQRVVEERDATALLLGGAEMRVFSEQGVTYAAPNMLYHYVRVHGYMPPDGFVRALFVQPTPPDPSYFERLGALGLAWSDALIFVPSMILPPIKKQPN